jgi:hypothetical protein
MGRNSSLDLLRLVALVGVIIYQWFGWVWTPIAIPFAALTFTVAGVLMAASLDRSGAYPWTVLAKRLRRVLLPVWGLAAIAIPLMVWYGSAAGAGPEIGTTPGWRSMLLWVVPLFEPPSSAVVCAGVSVADPDQPTSAVVLPTVATAHCGAARSRLGADLVRYLEREQPHW